MRYVVNVPCASTTVFCQSVQSAEQPCFERRSDLFRLTVRPRLTQIMLYNAVHSSVFPKHASQIYKFIVHHRHLSCIPYFHASHTYMYITSRLSQYRNSRPFISTQTFIINNIQIIIQSTTHFLRWTKFSPVMPRTFLIFLQLPATYSYLYITLSPR